MTTGRKSGSPEDSVGQKFRVCPVRMRGSEATPLGTSIPLYAMSGVPSGMKVPLQQLSW